MNKLVIYAIAGRVPDDAIPDQYQESNTFYRMLKILE